MDNSKNKGGRHTMEIKTKRIRPTEYTFESDAELEKFIHYATSNDPPR
jgi:hypothetical protein